MITNRVSDRSITFPVHDVSPVTNLKATWKTHEGVNALLQAAEEKGFHPILSCSGYNSNTIRQISYHGVMAAVHTAFAEHRPLSLSPDMIWITIMQGVARHVHNNPEQLRRRLVSHAGKQEVAFVVDGFNGDSPESDWQLLIDGLGDSLRMTIGETYDQLMVDFSTTGPLEKTVCAITILDAYEPFFEYVVYCICGIPSITLEGSVGDWRQLREKIEILAHFEMDWWLSSLRPILDHFVRAADGDIDREYWQNIYKLKKAYGWERINGWIGRLIPYLRHGETGEYNVVNPLLADPFVIEPDDAPMAVPSFFEHVPGIVAKDLPSGLSLVPFKFKSATETVGMQLIGGFVGIEQVEETQAIRPKLGWAVRKAGTSESLFDTFSKHCKIVPALHYAEFHEHFVRLDNETRFGGMPLPGEVAAFYRKCDGVVFPDSTIGSFRPMAKLERVCLPDEVDYYNDELNVVKQKSRDMGLTLEAYMEAESLAGREIRYTDTRQWLAFFDFPDGSFLAVDLAPRPDDNHEEVLKRVRKIDPAAKSSTIVFEGFNQALEALAEQVKCAG